MKKQFLILFAFISVFALSQVPQRFNKVIVTGDITSPKFIKTGSTVDSVLLGNGSSRAISTIKTDTVSLSNRINTKQDVLVSGTNIRTVNGNSVLGSGDIQIVSGGGGSPTNIYLSNVESAVSGYKNASPTIDPTETVKTITATPANTITWGEKYLYIAPVATTIIPSGFWELHAYGHVSTATGVSNLVFRIIRYSGSTETFLGTITSFEVNNTTDGEIFANGSLNDITVLAGDYLGIQVGFLSDGTTPTRTFTYTIGNGHATHFNTPLPTRHASLRDKNGELDFQHLTAAQVATFTATSANNTGDETLTSIKTKLGAASSVSDGYLKYQDFALLHTSTTVTASNGLSISGQNISLQNANTAQSGALTFNDWNTFNSKEPAITKNSGFNLPIGTTTGTVLEGRTFGTAANSAVGDFIQNQNSSAQSANMWINGIANIGSVTINSSQYIPITIQVPDAEFRQIRYQSPTKEHISYNRDANQNKALEVYREPINGYSALQLFNLTTSGAATFSSTVNSTGFLLNGNNLTSSLSTNYIPKWNGSSMVNSLIIDDGGKVVTNGGMFWLTGLGEINANVNGVGIWGGDNGGGIYSRGASGTGSFVINNISGNLALNTDGHVSVSSIANSTLPTTGALVVDGGVGVGGKINIGSTEQSDMDGTTINGGSISTNGGISAVKDINAGGNINAFGNIKATGDVYTNSNIKLDPIWQLNSIINGSVSGDMLCVMPIRTLYYKKVILHLNSFNGSATYTYPVSFTNQPVVLMTGGLSTSYVTSVGTTSVVITSASPTNGTLIIEGY